VSAEKISSLEKIDHFDVFEKLEDCLPSADIVFVAVKPYHSDELFQNMKALVKSDQLFISLMAGVTIETIQNSLDVKKVIRAMPNLPAKVGMGMTAFTAAKNVSRVELLMVRNLLDTTGEAIHV